MSTRREAAEMARKIRETPEAKERLLVAIGEARKNGDVVFAAHLIMSNATYLYEEVMRLRAENAKLRAENEKLKVVA